jgi:hypothetical protein
MTTPQPHEAFTHLPADIAAALAAYDARVADGQTVFDSEGFAVHAPDRMGGWVQANVALHLSVMDSGE